jgi:triosephosphate isomerase
MRKKVIAGNWKMNNDLGGTVSLMLKDSAIGLSAQNMCYEDSGAFTGEISGHMLKSVGCEYVILGHSERRTIFKESNETINKKIKKALEIGLKPIFCIGETLEERETNITEEVVERQIREGLKDISESELSDMIVAYEPVWAIGTGKTATPDQAQEVHNFIRNLVSGLFSQNLADNLVIQYGGSVKPDNASELLGQPDIDGALVGGACLKADSFVGIINSA